MKKGATLKQAEKILSLFTKTSTDQLQDILEAGFLADIRDTNIADVNRDKLRRFLGLKPLKLSSLRFIGEVLAKNLREMLIPAVERKELQNKILKLISGDKNPVIDATDGTEILAKANDVFNYIDSDFVAYGANEPDQATPETPARVYEMAKDATFAQMFGSLSGDLGTLYFTQAQIKGFVKKHRDWLRADSYATFFLFKSRNQFFVTIVHVASGGWLVVRVCRFDDSCIWDAEHRLRVVVPQPA